MSGIGNDWRDLTVKGYFYKVQSIKQEVEAMKQKIWDDGFGILILFTFLVGLYWLGGGGGEGLAEDSYRPNSKVVQGFNGYP